MQTLKHLPVNEWPEADREAFRTAYEPKWRGPWLTFNHIENPWLAAS